MTNTFRKRESHLITYEFGGRRTQIDYWLLKRTDLKRAMDCNVILSEIVAPQHKLLIQDLRMKLKAKRVPKSQEEEDGDVVVHLFIVCNFKSLIR